MQAIKNGIKTTLRTPGKTLLFVVILTVLSTLLSVAFCVFSAVSGYIKDADDYFHTIANLEFIGKDYPDQTVYDPAVEEAVAANEAELLRLKGSPAVIAYEGASPALGMIDGLHRFDKRTFDPSAMVMLVRVQTYDPLQQHHTVTVKKTLYSQTEHKALYLVANDGQGNESPFETDRDYLICGNFVNSTSSTPTVQVKEATFGEKGMSVSVPAFEKFEGDEPDEDSVFMRYAEILKLQNNACRITYTADIEDCFPFHQQVLKLKEGRLFTDAEEASAARACIVSQSIADLMKLKLGDKTDLSVLVSDTSIFETDTLREKDRGEYEIVGIVYDSEDYPYWIFLPGKLESGFKAATGYTIGQFRLKNDSAAEFLKEAETLAGKGFRVTVYDQGYAAATEPMRELRFISLVFLAVCVLLALVALVLQSHVFVSRQREAAHTMYSLGSGRGHIVVYYLSSALALTALGAFVGMIIAKSIEGRVFEIMQRFATQFAQADMRFSSSRLSLVRTLDFAPNAGSRPYIIAGASLVLGALVATLLFARRTVAKRRKQERSRSAERGASGFSVKYALLSIVRSPVRTVSVLLLAAVAALFFSRLTQSLRGYEAQLENYKQSAVITGYVTDMSGRWMDGLIIKKEPIRAIMEKGTVKDYNLTKKLGYCQYLGVSISADGTEHDLSYTPPGGEFAFETRVYNISRSMKWVGTSQIESSPMFKYAKSKNITWLEGFDPMDFWFPNPVCAMPESLMNEKKIKLGDRVLLEAAIEVGGYSYVGVMLLKVVASYAATTSSDTLLVPLEEFANWSLSKSFEDAKSYYDFFGTAYEDQFAPKLAPTLDERIVNRIINGYEDSNFAWSYGEEEKYSGVKYSSFLFTLKDAAKLDEAREAFKEAGYGTVGNMSERSKPYVIIEDEMHLNTVRSMERQIQYVSTLYYALYIIAGAIGFALAWLLTVSRRKEIALMRALGTPNLRIIFNFFFEHALLCLAGLGIGLAAAILIFGAQEKACFMLSAAFFALWCLATLLCLVFGLAKRAQAALTEAE